MSPHTKFGLVRISILSVMIRTHSPLLDAIQDIEKVFAGFATTCAAAGSTSCAIATNSSTPASILKWIRHLMDDAFDYHKAGGSFGSATIRCKRVFSCVSADSDVFNLVLLLGSMYTPVGWPTLATQLYQLSETLYKNGASNGTSPTAKRTLHPITLPVRASGPLGILPKTLFKRTEDPSTFDYAIYAISCGDAADSGDTTTADVFKEIISASYNVSQTCKCLACVLTIICALTVVFSWALFRRSTLLVSKASQFFCFGFEISTPLDQMACPSGRTVLWAMESQTSHSNSAHFEYRGSDHASRGCGSRR
jgi:hypothetical protein